MEATGNRPSLCRYLAIACVLGLCLSGCTVVGPSAVRSGRLAYNAAINQTNSQQMLMFVIQNRYEKVAACWP